jgi:ubiquinone/menaquinone biosynthesis C-methylase UbiE
MDEAQGHLERIRRQFTRQAEAYAGMAVTRDEAGHRAIAGLAGAGPGRRVLDVACGPGLLSLACAAAGAEVLGVDATEALLALAREEAARRGVASAEFRRGDATALALPDGHFDAVVCRAAFHHFPAPERVLAEMVRVAKPEATLVVADLLGSEDPERAALHDRIERLCDPTHVRALPESAFRALFREAGLELALCPKSEIGYDAEDWIAHGGPDAEAAAEIRRLLEASIEGDRAGLAVQREEGRLRFRHRAAVFVLRRRRD